MTVTYFSQFRSLGRILHRCAWDAFFLVGTKVFFGYKDQSDFFLGHQSLFLGYEMLFFRGTQLLDIFEGQRGLIDYKIVLDLLEAQRVSPIVQLLLTLWKGFFSSCVFRRRAMLRKEWSTVEVPMDGCK